MSEPKIISPLLENYIIGQPISEHQGVVCCPALLRGTEEKFMVKIISHPASASRLDALLLAGVCKDAQDALEYFRRQAEDTAAEAALLQKLAQVEGFQGFEGWQLEKMDDQTGYDLYLLGRYGLTLARQMQEKSLTHLAAVNLGLDLCAALSVCRRMGYLYVDLRPENICFTENKEFRICDLGFVSLDSLKYTSLPDKYRSVYTAPEILDAYSSLNTTMDIYAMGLVLYQVFNDGSLPEDLTAPAAPMYADFEMAQIILKACACQPEDRWQDPKDMGQALINYMQSHNVNDTPIIPVPVEEPEEPEEVEETPAEITEEEAPVEEETEVSNEEPTPVEEEAEESPAEPMDELEEAEQFVIDGFLFDDEDAEMPTQEELFSQEVDEMLAQADELIAHRTPDPVVAPEPIEVPIPDPILPEPEEVPQEEPESDEPLQELTEEIPEQLPIEVPEEAGDIPEEEPKAKPTLSGGKLRKLIAGLAAILLILVLAAGGWYYHQNIYLQEVKDITADVFENQAVIHLDTQIDNSLLTVVCTDTYGNTLRQSVMNNTAVFTSLNAGTSYKISLVIEGNHKLFGDTSATFTTPSQTNIVTFTATAGDQDGAVILNFSVQGADSHTWHLFYSAEGEPEQSVLCSGHMATVTGLTVGKTYSFRLVPEVELYLVGNKTLEYTAQAVVYPENLTIQGFDNGNLLVIWDAPQDAAVESWIVRCYNSDGFDQTYTVTDTCIAIEDLDMTLGYTVEVKAAGMTVSKRTEISANSVTFKEILLDDFLPGQLNIAWTYEGIAPENGWNVRFTCADGESFVLSTQETSLTLSSLIPGNTYTIEFIFSGEITVIGGKTQYTMAYRELDAYGLKPENLTFRMCWTPDRQDWYWNQLWEEDFTNTFRLGESASFVLHTDVTPEMSDETVSTYFLIRGADGHALTSAFGDDILWNSAWDRNYTQLDMPLMPGQAGDYTVEIFFDGCFVASIDFTVTE